MARGALSTEMYGTVFWSLASTLLMIIIALSSAQYYLAPNANPSTTNYGFAPHSGALLYATALALLMAFVFLLAAVLAMKSRRAGPAISSLLSSILIIVIMAIGFVWTGYGALMTAVAFVTLFFSYRSLTIA